MSVYVYDPTQLSESLTSRILRRMERDMYVYWEDLGTVERIPKVIRMHPTLYHNIVREFEQRVTSNWHYMYNESMRQGERWPSPILRTLFGDYYLIEDSMLPDGMYVFDDYEAWKGRLELFQRIKEEAAYWRGKVER